MEKVIRKEYGKYDGNLVEPMCEVIANFWDELTATELESEVMAEEVIREILEEIVCDGSNWFADMLMVDAEKCRELASKCLWRDEFLFYDTIELATEVFKEAIVSLLMNDSEAIEAIEEILLNND